MTTQSPRVTKASTAPVRLVEKRVSRRAPLSRKRRPKSRGRGAAVAALAFVTAFVGLFVNAHAALNARYHDAARLATDNNRLGQRIATLDSANSDLTLKLALPDDTTIHQLGLIRDGSERHFLHSAGTSR